MEKINLSPAALVALGLHNADDAATLSKAVEKLAADCSNANTKITELAGKLKSITEKGAKDMLDAAQLEGRITGEERAEYEELALSNPSLCQKMLAKLEAKQTLSDKIKKTSKLAADAVKTADDFEKLSLDAQLAFKRDNKAEYDALFV